jgi:cytosine/adenosine deaminase-related metal-dependent hydrolase
VPALAIRGGLVVTMDVERSAAPRDLLVNAEGRIAAVVEPGSPRPGEQTIDATGCVVVPGLVQAHVHLCQTLFRGLAEDRALLGWLRERIWPLEAAHDADSMRASARLGIAELLLGGTTTVLDMGTVHHTQVLFEAAAETGIRYTGGKAMMDAGEGVPAGLLQPTGDALRESDQLSDRWHDTQGGRLRYAYSPRFALTSTVDLLRSVAVRARSNDLLVHTHASEQKAETELIRQRFGTSNIQLLANLGLCDGNVCLAHCVWPEDQEVDTLASGGAHVVHCPSCNMKLGSGVAPVVEYLDAGINVALGADGAASNNRLDGWEELRLAGLLARLRGGPTALAAVEAFELATLGGARALGLDAETGSLEVGKWADLAILDLRKPHAAAAGDDVYAQLVFAAGAEDVRTVLVGGQPLVDQGRLLRLDVDETLRDAERQRDAVAKRAGLG